ncbi:MAG: choice-of-anchor X domain-containing protein [bacterium]
MRKIFLVILSVTLAAFVSGCSKSAKTSVTSSVPEQQLVQEVINDNPDLFLIDPTEDEDVDYSPILQSSASLAPFYTDAQEATLPVGWGRRREGFPEREISISISGDTAYVTVQKQVEGKLYIDRTDDGIKNPGSKPIDDTVTKKAYLEKVFGHWQLQELSCADVALTESVNQTVSITQVELRGTNPDGSAEYYIDDPLNLMDLNTEFPYFSKGTEVTVIATVDNTLDDWNPPVFVFLHYGKFRHNHRRVQMFDDATHGDEVADDGKYTNSWTIQSNARIYRHLTVDVLDSGTMQNESNDDYNSGAWRIPYRTK